MNRIHAVILDWAGTTVDFGSFAPTQIFVEAFRQAFDVEITLAEARVPMGLGKWQHIEALGKLPAVDARWQAKFGRSMSAADIDAIYAAFMPLQIAKVVDFSSPIAGVIDTIAALRAEGIKIGSCSGYPRAVMERSARRRRAWLLSDHWVATDDWPRVAAPWMALQNVIALGIDAVAHCVKVDDAAPGISEGLTRGCGRWGWRYRVTNSAQHGTPIRQCRKRTLRSAASTRPASCTPPGRITWWIHWRIYRVIAHINARLAQGERP